MSDVLNVFSELSHLPVALFAGMLGLLGLLVGSFLNVVIVRLPIMMARSERLYVLQTYDTHLTGADTDSEHAAQRKHEHRQAPSIPEELQETYNLYTPASHCPCCKAPVRWWMNIPVLSFVWLKGRCGTCSQAIAWQYPVVELLAALAGVVSAFVFGVTGTALAVMLLLLALLTLTVIDLNTYLLPDIIVLPMLWLGLLFNAVGGLTTLQSAVWGAVVGYMSLWTVYQLFKLLTGKEGMGFGDFKLLAALGAWLGVSMVLPIVLFSSVAGALMGGALILSKRLQAQNPIAFGPYLAVGGVLALFYGQSAITWYLGFLRL